jgi:hypothetical protein
MQRIFNKDGFIWWIGVVEDRRDPEKMGRCKVRIFGYHSESKVLLPTKDLPWAIPIHPSTSAALSGVGSSPLGPIEGTWVVGFFLDGADMQQPTYFGCISTKIGETTTGEKAPVFTTPPEKPIVENPAATSVLRDSQGAPVTDSQGQPIQTGIPPVPGWELGKTSEKYETGGKGPGTINDYNGAAAGDLGGASYGSYQFASFLPKFMKGDKARPNSNNSPVQQYIANSKFRDQFDGLVPATSEFDSKWRSIASSNSAEFKKDQHDYVQRKYYDVMIANLQRAGLDLSKYGPGVQDLIWSTAVQFGPARTSIFTTPLLGKSELTDKDIILLVSQYKIDNVNTFFKSSSEGIRAGVRSRFESEKNDLLQLARA